MTGRLLSSFAVFLVLIAPAQPAAAPKPVERPDAVAVQSGPWELFDLKTEGAEQHSLVVKMPEKAEELASLAAADRWLGLAGAQDCFHVTIQAT
jgi:hypothetical protein